MGPEGTAEPPSALVVALRKLLKPLVRLLVAQQIPYGFMSDVLKGLYVEVAEKDFPIAGRPQTDSRISLLTGVHRRDVKRLREELQRGPAIPSKASFGAQLAARWNADFADASGDPLPLAVQSQEPSEPSFELLVESISKDIRARPVLDEWLRLGVVRFDDQGRVVLDSGAFVPTRGFDEKLAYFGRNLHDHIAAAAHNVMGAEPSFMERSVHYGALSDASSDELASLAEEAGMHALREVNRRARELKAGDEAKGPDGRRIHFGVYFYADESGEDEAEDG